jgi:hypothetical protein
LIADKWGNKSAHDAVPVVAAKLTGKQIKRAQKKAYEWTAQHGRLMLLGNP